MRDVRQDRLLSVPPTMCEQFTQCEPGAAETCFVTCDPPGQQLGSGGGTAHVLAEAWRARSNTEQSFEDWLDDSLKVVIHGGGRSRRVPAYAGAGKLFIPVPAFRWDLGQRLDQTLLDAQTPFLREAGERAAAGSRVMIVSGDALLRCDHALPELPDADVVLLGFWAQPEEAQHFGVMFCERGNPQQLVSFLQKPSPDRIRQLAADWLFLIDVGVWMLSRKAALCLMAKCGWQREAQAFDGEGAHLYDLYGEWGLHFGRNPEIVDQAVNSLTTAVVPLPGGSFYHFGKSRDIIDSAYQLQNLVIDQTKLGAPGAQPHPKQFLQNSVFECPLRHDTNHTLWVENSWIPGSWSLAHEHVLTGVPQNDWTLSLEPGVCLDFVPIGEAELCLRAYHIDDCFRGPVGEVSTEWLGRPLADWLRDRSLTLADLGIDDTTDIQDAPLFPVFDGKAVEPALIEWMTCAAPPDNARCRTTLLQQPRLSATDLGCHINLPRLYAQRRELLQKILPAMAANYERSIFYKLDLESTAALCARHSDILDDVPAPGEDASALVLMHDRMFRSTLLRRLGRPGHEEFERAAFTALRDAIVTPYREKPSLPRCDVLEDQIVWGRAPVRLDLAGGWTDTPPYCLEHGGAVLNLAVDLNGQPPVQVFARLTETPELVIRSIDLGREERLSTYEEVRDYDRLGSGFAIARAAFALVGFHPLFNGESYGTLHEQLTAFGGGIEISMLAAIPKGSGLGTSSILAAALLGTLSDLVGLDWDQVEIIGRTLALEQMLTSGGGWQDQVGGVLHGAKLVETQPGLDQTPHTRWVPDRFFEGPSVSDRMLLYYTGVTRVAHNILGEIVRGIFLNSRRRLEILAEIGQAAHFAYDSIVRNDIEGLAEAIRRSWNLNQRLDPGTNVPDVQVILDTCDNDLAAAKLLGAGGGGYMVMVARDAESARRIRSRLQAAPPNNKARFVDMTLSKTGLHITRS